MLTSQYSAVLTLCLTTGIAGRSALCGDVSADIQECCVNAALVFLLGVLMKCGFLRGELHVDLRGELHVDLRGELHADLRGELHVYLRGELHVDLRGVGTCRIAPGECREDEDIPELAGEVSCPGAGT